MITCTIKDCGEYVSEHFSDKPTLSRWIIIRACRCGAFDLRNKKSCTCRSEGPVQISYWPNLDWWAFGGVDEIILCPRHRKEIADEIIQQRNLDPSMNSTRQDHGNVH